MHSLEDIFYSTSWPLNYSSTLFDNLTYNNTNATEAPSGGNQWHLPWWRQMIWTVLFAGMIVVATGGNLIVIWIVLAHKRMRTVTNYFLVNLSIADAMVSTLNVIFNYTYMLNSHWPFGNLYCKISQFIAVLTICASVFTLMAISIDRIDIVLHYFLFYVMQPKTDLRTLENLAILGGLVSGKEISSEGLHRSDNDEVHDLSEEFFKNNHLNSGYSVLDPSESQSTTVLSISTTAGQALLSSTLDEEGLDRTVSENLISTTKRTDNSNGVTTKQFSDETDGNISDGWMEATGNSDQTTEFLPVMLIPSNPTHNQQNQAKLETAIMANDPSPERQENFTLVDDVPPSSLPPELNDQPESRGRKMNSDVQSTVEAIIDPISNTEASVKSNSVSGTDDVSVENLNLKPTEAVESGYELSEQIFQNSTDTVTPQQTDLPECNSSRGQYFEVLNNGYAADDIKISEKSKDERPPDASGANSTRGITENWLSVLQSIVPSQKERMDFYEKMLQFVQNMVSNSNVNHNVMNNSSPVPCSCSTPPESSNLYPSPHSLSPPIPEPELPPGDFIKSDLPEEYQEFEIEPRSRYIDYDEVKKQNLHGPKHFLDRLVGLGVQPVEKQYISMMQVKGDSIIHSEPQPMRLARICRKILVTSKPTCRKRRPVCYTPCRGCHRVCRPRRIICREHPSPRPKVNLVCKRIWTHISWPGIIYPIQDYDSSDYEIFDEQDRLLYESEQDSLGLQSDGYEHEITGLEILPIVASFEQIFEPVFDVGDTVSEDEEDSAVSEQLSIAAFRKAISEAPEILASEPTEDLVSEIVQELDPVPVPSAADATLKVANPSPNLVEPKAPASDGDQSEKAEDEIDKLSVALPELPSKAVVVKEPGPDYGQKIAYGNANYNVNLNPNVNFDGNIAVRKPVPPDVQVPVISPIIEPPILPKPATDNGDLNTNANVVMNLNINENHDANVSYSNRLPVKPIGEPEPVEVSETSQVEQIMPVFEYEAASVNAADIDNVSQNTNVNMNSNTNLSENHNLNDEVEVPYQSKTEVPTVNIIPQTQQPTVLQILPKTMTKPAKNFEQILNTNVNSNVDINHNNNVNRNVQVPRTPDADGQKDAVLDKIPVLLSDIVLPSIERGNQNTNVNLNVNSSITNNTNESGEPVISKARNHIPIAIPEPVQVAEPPAEVSAPVYEVPSLPASALSLNFNSNLNHNLNSNVNLDIINDTNRNVVQQHQQSLIEPINQPIPASTFTPTEAAPKLILVPEVADSTLRANQHVDENLNSKLNLKSDQNFDQDTTNQAIQVLPEILPVLQEPVLTQTISVNVPGVNGNLNSNFNTYQNINRNVNMNSNVDMNSNHIAAVNFPGLPKPGAPVIIPGPRPVAEVAEIALPQVVSVRHRSSQVSQDHKFNVYYNSNINNDVNRKMSVPFKQLVSSVIKPVESQPVAAPKHSEIPALTSAQIDVNQNLNANANVSNNVNVNMDVNADHKVNGVADYKIGENEMLEAQKIAEESVMVSTFSDRVVTEAPRLEQIGIFRTNENAELIENQNTNSNMNYKSNVTVNQNSNFNENNNIESQRIISMPTPVPDTVSVHEPIPLPHQDQASISPHAPIVKPEILQSFKSNVNYNANVNVDHNLTSNANFNQENQVGGQGSILFPPSPWIQELESQIIPNVGLNLIHNSDVDFKQNSNTNVNHNVSLNGYRNIVSREPNAILVTLEDFNKNNYHPILKPNVREPVTIAAPTLVLDEKKKSVPQVTGDSQVNVNQNANANMNYSSNYNNNANYNGKAATNENENGKLPLMKSPQNVLAPVIVPQSQQDQGMGLWNVQKNSNVNANYNSNMNYNANVNANSNYYSNPGQSGLGILTEGNGGTRGDSPGIQSLTFTANSAPSAPMIPNTVIGANFKSAEFGYGARQDINTNANFDSNSNHSSNYNANHNHNAGYHAQLTSVPNSPKSKGWYELWYNNGDDKDGWTEIWNNKQFKKFLDQQLKEINQRKDAQAPGETEAQAFAIVR